MENKTHWRKNNDSRYISGEDLRSGLKGLSPEMVVKIVKFEDTDVYDQNQNQKQIKTGFWLATLDGKTLPKAVILNNTNAKFCVKEFKSEFMEDWIGKTLVLYACPDKRFGHVARFKKYIPSVTDPTSAINKLNQSTSLAELSQNWASLSTEEKNIKSVIDKKDELKAKYSA